MSVVTFEYKKDEEYKSAAQMLDALYTLGLVKDIWTADRLLVVKVMQDFTVGFIEGEKIEEETEETDG